MNASDLLICPECKNKLLLKENKLLCSSCHMECTFDNGVYDFLGDNSYYWGEIPLEEAENFLLTAKVEGWKAATSMLSSTHPEIGEYVMSKGRADWFSHCVDHSNTKSFLDIGSGWGAITFALSGYFDEVWSLEAVRQRIEFQRIRQQQEKIGNIKFVRSDWMNLPFPDNYFDIVAANGVLEWIGLSDYSKNPRDLQIEFVAEVRRILKPGGCLYIGIENRFAWNCLLGAEDHSGLRFTSLWPRKISDIIVRLSKKAGGYRKQSKMDEWPNYRTYTYSKWGYRDLLKAAGFKQVEFYWTDNYNQPRFTGKLKDRSFTDFLKSLRSHEGFASWISSIAAAFIIHIPVWASRILISLFVSDFLIFAYKGN